MAGNNAMNTISTISQEEAIERYKQGGLARCEFRRSPFDTGCMNLVIFENEEPSSEMWRLLDKDGSLLEIVNFDYAFQVAFSIGFSLEELDLNMEP